MPFNLKEYFNFIGLVDYQPEPTLESLSKIIKHHLFTFHYQNMALYLEGKKTETERQIPSLDVNTIFQQMVVEKKAGYCFQNIELLYAVLQECDFDVYRHLAKVVNQPLQEIDQTKVNNITPAHEVLIINIESAAYIVDTAFANHSLRAPLKFIAGEQTIESDCYYLKNVNSDWQLSVKIFKPTQDKAEKQEDNWLCLYQFSKKHIVEDDLLKTHRDLYFADNVSIRTDKVLFSKVTAEKRKMLVWFTDGSFNLFRSLRKDGSIRSEKTFTSLEEATTFAATKFR